MNPHAAAADAMAVAAAPFYEQTTPESFTSDGPALIYFNANGTRLASPVTRAKPDIMSIDGTDNTILGNDDFDTGFPNFFGTSAATPHAAAVAALMLQANPSLTPAQLYAQMKATATPVSAPANVAGAGLVDAYRAVYGTPVPATLPAFDGFETGAATQPWLIYKTGAGDVVATTADSPESGSYQLAFQSSLNGFEFSTLDEATFNVNAAGGQNVTLTYDLKAFDTVGAPASTTMPASFTGHGSYTGVSFSVDGNTWYKLSNIDITQTANQSYQAFSFNLSQMATSLGLTLSSDTQIKFQYSSTQAWYLSNAGIAIDNVSVTGTVNQAPAFTSADHTTFTVGTAGSFTVTASGVPTPTLSENSSDTLPTGVTFNAATGVLSGTPAAGTGGTYTLHFTASNGVLPDATQIFTLTVSQATQAPTFTSADHTTFTVGTAGSFTVTASGVPTPTLSENSSDTLPTGVTFNAATGVLSGTPAAGTGGTYTLHFTASNGVLPDAAQTFTLTVNQAPAFTSADHTTFTVGTAGSFTVTASGVPAPTLSENSSDTLPTGVTFNAATGVLSGTPAAGTGGTYTLHFTASNGVLPDAAQTFTLTVNQAPAFTSADHTTFTVGTAGSFTVTASGVPTPTLSENSSDTLPTGVTFNAATGVLSGTPAAGTGGTYTLHFTASNGVLPDATQIFTLTVSQATQAPTFTSADHTTFTAELYPHLIIDRSTHSN